MIFGYVIDPQIASCLADEVGRREFDLILRAIEENGVVCDRKRIGSIQDCLDGVALLDEEARNVAYGTITRLIEIRKNPKRFVFVTTSDGTVDPAGSLSALASLARDSGADSVIWSGRGDQAATDGYRGVSIIPLSKYGQSEAEASRRSLLLSPHTLDKRPQKEVAEIFSRIVRYAHTVDLLDVYFGTSEDRRFRDYSSSLLWLIDLWNQTSAIRGPAKRDMCLWTMLESTHGTPPEVLDKRRECLAQLRDTAAARGVRLNIRLLTNKKRFRDRYIWAKGRAYRVGHDLRIIDAKKGECQVQVISIQPEGLSLLNDLRHSTAADL